MNKIKRLLSDFGLRISASLISTFSNQIILLPILSYVFSNAEYGNILTIVGVYHVITMALGNSLHSTRLVMNAEYQSQNKEGDFNYLVFLFSIIGVFCIAIYSVFNKNIDFFTLLLFCPAVFLGVLNTYFTVWYTIKLKFRLALIQSIIASIGTLLGALLVKLTNCWPLAYLCSAIFSFVVIYYNTDVFKEGFSKTPLFKKTFNKWTILSITTLLASLVTYLDRLLLNPLLGADSVAIYYTSTYFGKALSILTMPVASVMLGYYAQKNFKFNLKRFWAINLVCFIMLILFIFLSIGIGESITGYLFPKIIKEASPYILIGNVSAAIVAISNILKAAALKYAHISFQIILQIVYMVIYFAGGIISVKHYGLIGFCYATLLSNILYLTLLIIISHYSIKRLYPCICS